MEYRFPHRREFKTSAKRLMNNSVSMRATLVVVCCMLAAFGLKVVLGAQLTYALVDLANYQNTATGIYFNDNGFSVIFRMDLTQMVLAIPLTYTQIGAFLGVGALVFVVIAPLRMGAMEVYWGLLRGDQLKFLNIFQWLAQAGRMWKAVAVEFVLQVAVRVIGLIATLPSLYLYYIFYSTYTTIDQLDAQASLLQNGGATLALAAGILSFWLHCFFLPVRYCLAAHPEYTLADTFRRGLRSTQGARGRFFWFRLTFAPWYFLSQLSYNTLDLYVLPYTSLASMLYVQEIARARQAQDSAPQSPGLPPQ